MAKDPANPTSRASARAHGSKAAKAVAMPPVRPGYYKGENYRVNESVGFLMKQAIELQSRAIEARMAEYSITDAQWRPLFLLSLHDWSTVSQIARHVGCDAGATTRMVDRLEDKGMVRRVRSTDDRRVQQVELTDEGKQVAAIVPYVIADVLNMHLAELSNGEIETLRRLLERIVATGRRESEKRESAEGNR